MNHILNIAKKELDKVFRNPRLVLSTFIIPGLLIFIIYSLMGNVINDQQNEINNQKSIIYVVNKPESLEMAKTYYVDVIEKEANNSPLNVEFKDFSEDLNEKEMDLNITSENINAYLYFEDNFDVKMQSYLKNETTIAPKVMYYFNSTVTSSQVAGSKIEALVNIIKGMNERVINLEVKELAQEEAKSNQMIAMLLPMLIMIFVFAGGLSVGSDAIAGEKERGTIATLLMTPISKNQIVLGKVISTAIITILSAFGSFIGAALSLPEMASSFGDVTALSYDAFSYIELLLLIVMTALLSTSLCLIASTIAKSTKEATTYAMPSYILAMLVGVLTISSTRMPTEIGPYLIPLYNLGLGMKGILLMQLEIPSFLLIVASNLFYFAIITYLITRLFKSEKLMFAK